MTSPSSGKGVSAALRALQGGQGKPTDDDRPSPSTFPGRQPTLLPGQLDLDGHEIPGVKDEPSQAA